MELATSEQTSTSETKQGSPPLQSGDRLTVAEFHRRYHQHPEIKKAEVVEGVVYVSSPVYAAHGEPHLSINFWIGLYLTQTPGMRVADTLSVRLDNENEVQPDVCLWFNAGNAQLTQEGMLAGAPDLVVEVAASSASYNLHQKLRVYQRSGVREYLVLLAYEEETRWYHLDEGVFHPIVADDQGILRSHIFPGLWLNPSHVWGGDFAGMHTLVQQGLQSPEHAELIKTLQP